MTVPAAPRYVVVDDENYAILVQDKSKLQEWVDDGSIDKECRIFEVAREARVKVKHEVEVDFNNALLPNDC